MHAEFECVRPDFVHQLIVIERLANDITAIHTSHKQEIHTLADPLSVAPSAPLLSLYITTQRPRSSLAKVDKATMMARISCSKQARMRQATWKIATYQGSDLIIIPFRKLLQNVITGRAIEIEPSPVTEQDARKSGWHARCIKE